MMKGEIYIVCGATASGKSDYAIKLAQSVNGVIINADSMQIYKEIPIITAQPSEEQKKIVEHRLYGEISCIENCSVKKWLDLAYIEIERCFLNGKTPILVGGTGMYIDALMGGLSQMPIISEDIKSRVAIMSDGKSTDELRKILYSYIGEEANLIQDRYRIVRELLVYFESGYSKKYWHNKSREPHYSIDQFKVIYFDIERDKLYGKINDRVHQMIKNGAIEEVHNLLSSYSYDMLPLAIGIKELRAYISGVVILEEAIKEIQKRTRNYAKRQNTWFSNKVQKSCYKIFM